MHFHFAWAGHIFLIITEFKLVMVSYDRILSKKGSDYDIFGVYV